MSDLFLDRFELRRHPPTRDDTLRAWDAADEYLVRWLSGEESGGPGFPAPPPIGERGPLRIVNDRFGALTVAAAADALSIGGAGDGGPPITVESDSALALEAVRRSVASLGESRPIVFDPDPDTPAMFPEEVTSSEGAAGATWAIIKVPRTLSLLEDQLAGLVRRLPPGAPIVGAGMTRQVHTSTIRAFEEIVGPAVTSHARRKSRLLHAVVTHPPSPGPAPVEWSAFGVHTVNLPGVFSAAGLDLGSRAMLDALGLEGDGGPTSGPLAGWTPGGIADVGCGNGVLGVAAARTWPDAELHLADDSFRAVESARRTAVRTLGPARTVTLHVGDALSGVPDGSIDLVLCNPPFHAQGARGDDTAWRMFVDARRALAPGGRLYVVGNRHLGYHVALGRLFGRAEVVGSTPKFTVLEARKD